MNLFSMYVIKTKVMATVIPNVKVSHEHNSVLYMCQCTDAAAHKG